MDCEINCGIKYEIKCELPSVDEWLNLRRLAGWNVYDRKAAERGIENSLYGVCAYSDGKLIAMARIIGDGATCYYIQDMIVIPEWQKKGIGSKVLTCIMDYIKNNVAKGSIVALMSAKGREKFYEKFGFIKRPNENLGCGMTWLPNYMEDSD